MSVRSTWEARHDLGSISRGQLVLRAVVVLSAAIFAGALAVAGDPGAAAVTGALLLGGCTAALPHSGWPVLTLTYFLLSWVVTVDSATFWVLPAALSMLALHTACALTSTAPAQADLPAGYAVVHGRRLGVVAGLTVLGAAIVLPTASTRLPGGLTASLVALVVLLLGLALHYGVLARRDA